MRTDEYDIVIAGGGMIGISLALALAPLGQRIAVVEAIERSAPLQPSFDDRSTALSRSSQRTFEALGLWPAIRAASTAIRHIHVSDRGRFGFSHIDAAEQNVEALGYVVINRVLGTVLNDALLAADNVDVICPARISRVQTTERSVTVSADSNDDVRQLQCRLLVAADGANSGVREMLGIGAQHVDYGQHAVIGNLQPGQPHNNIAYERFTNDGPIAILPTADDRVTFVWTLQPERADNVLSLSDEEFTEQLQQAFGFRLGRFSKMGKRARYPLSLSKANSLVVGRGVLVGNAAHGLHPVAAQGFNLGLRDVASLADCIADALADGAGDPGDATVLERYAEWRRADQKKLVHFTDGLVRLFGSRRRSLRLLRDVGMLGFDLVPGVRRLFARHTMGLAGELPRLSRGVPLK
ncbi:2-octaprenyl-6-methoxyphenyl hydroxylase [Woeseia oceani]|uniref:2-octaprenyl-6-methoxyphenyl hydroxylase n=1 Tax=Woeseia oceani TaxID=1548547 RepID=A0A193LHG4_9GAMM|nr:2-octaprenyl-6-methoxyphenyl hydroxylase [Woeseia oceani]ANO51965.1 2-octaprenyl-6-methoxyphenyl hydroxylase [Woeseia oceani]